MSEIRFRFSPEKAQAAIHWMVSQGRPVDLHLVLKACYFADKQHLNQHGRPIFGATYRAMRFGPVPLEIYEMAKGEPLWLSETGRSSFPWRLDGYVLSIVGNSEPDLDVLSETDFEAVKRAFALSSSMSFNARTSATHGLDWQRAELGQMRYEDMIDDEKKADLLPYLLEHSRHIRL